MLILLIVFVVCALAGAAYVRCDGMSYSSFQMLTLHSKVVLAYHREKVAFEREFGHKDDETGTTLLPTDQGTLPHLTISRASGGGSARTSEIMSGASTMNDYQSVNR